ncbi:hypothetical protein ACFQPG_01070 [Sphingomonas sp. GCM10030256]|uniref:hypothetical protein n=1 Tax=Sphingomonas sp. GCM10030256 TaxID=3273427 RepID=UPI00360868CD
MSKKDDVAPPPPRDERSWTRVEDYLDLQRLWRRSTARRRRRLEPRTEPEKPRFALGLLPFLLLMSAMLVLAVLIIIAAVPGKPRPAGRDAPAEVGTARPGWLND